MNQEIQYFIFKETSQGKYSFTSKLISPNKFVDHLNSKYLPGIINRSTKEVGDYHAIIGYTDTYLHNYFIISEYLESSILEIRTLDTQTNNSNVFKFDLSSFCILCNRVATAQGGNLDFLYLHPNPLKKIQKYAHLDYAGISIVPPHTSDIQATELAREFYDDIIPLFENLVANHKVQ